jgi:hypothetical protein
MCLSTMPQNVALGITYNNTRDKMKHPIFADNMANRANFSLRHIWFIDRGFLQNKMSERKHRIASVASKPLVAMFLLLGTLKRGNLEILC